MNRVAGQARPSRLTINLIAAAGCWAPVDFAGPQPARQHRLVAEHLQRQVAAVVVVGVEGAKLLRPCSGASDAPMSSTSSAGDFSWLDEVCS